MVSFRISGSKFPIAGIKNLLFQILCKTLCINFHILSFICQIYSYNTHTQVFSLSGDSLQTFPLIVYIATAKELKKVNKEQSCAIHEK